MDFTLLVYTLLNEIQFLPQLLVPSQDGAVLVCLLSCFKPVLRSAHFLIFRFPSERSCRFCTVSLWQQGQWTFGEVAGGGMCPFCSFLLRKWVVGSWMAIRYCPWHRGPVVWYHGIVPSLLCGKHPVLPGRRSSRWCRKALICWL